MSKKYSDWSGSQGNIGRRLIDTAAQSANSLLDSDKFSLIDVACGPGVLTKLLIEKLEATVGEVVSVAALDYDPSMLSKVKVTLPNCTFYQQDFYTSLPDKQKFDIIFSNEGLHWIPMSSDAIPNLHGNTPQVLRDEFGQQFIDWGNDLLTKSLSNLRSLTTENGIAVLQLGREGQLNKLWDLVAATLSEAGAVGVSKEMIFPLYYPSEIDLLQCIKQSGYQVEEIYLFKEDLSEESASDITLFLKGFSECGLTRLLTEKKLEWFYKRIEEKLLDMNLVAFRKGQWHRSILVLVNK